MHQPKYPVYIPSKGRPERALTADLFDRDSVAFRLVVEEAEADAYAAKYGEHRVLVLPFSDAGSVVPARNWIRDHAEAEGHDRHWQYDDNVRAMFRVVQNRRLYVRSGVALKVLEDFTDRYTNVAISGFQYKMFLPLSNHAGWAPFTINQHVYSAALFNHAMPYRWRGRYNEDSDICLQALGGGWCTILMNAFLADKLPTMTMKGGNTDELEYFNDGRLKMARALERKWPGVVRTTRRFQRPQHQVAYEWKKFDTPLQRRTDIEWPEGVDDYGMRVTAVKEVKTPYLQSLLDDAE